MPSAVCFERSASPFGCRRLTLKSRHHDCCGVRSMYSWTAVVSQFVTTLTPRLLRRQGCWCSVLNRWCFTAVFYSVVISDVHLTSFEPVSVDEVVAAVQALPDKTCALDHQPIPTLKYIIKNLVPFLTELFNISRPTGCVTAVFKAAYILPHLKKVNLDSSDVRFRPISKPISPFEAT